MIPAWGEKRFRMCVLKCTSHADLVVQYRKKKKKLHIDTHDSHTSNFFFFPKSQTMIKYIHSGENTVD